MKRILSIDGGGIRGLFALQTLKRIEQLVQEKHHQPLHEYFDFIAGTSTGSIIASLLSWGYSAAEVDNIYWTNAKDIFAMNRLDRLFMSRFRADRLSALLKNKFSEKDGSPALLGTDQLKTLLLVVMRNASTGSPWPLCNNPQAMYNDQSLPDCNLNLPLWQIVRASTAAPTYFQPEKLPMGDQDFWFIDGAVSAYNNPALIAFLFAALPEYRINWETGEDRLLVVSAGTGACRKYPMKKSPHRMNLLEQAEFAFNLTIDSLVMHEDLLCRLWGKCLCGPQIDSEIGDLKNSALIENKKFSYVRYDQIFSPEDIRHPRFGNLLAIDNLRAIPFLREAGADFAEKTVLGEHLL